MFEETIQQKSINALRILSAEEISRAKTGHPGICMDAAPIIYTLYADVMKYDNTNPCWQNRDRFVLSAGHGSALLYAALHLFGFGLGKSDLMAFRKYGSKTPGHPEHGVTAGVDATTGPLGQGIANAVGMTLAEAYLAAKFNRPGFTAVSHYTYCLCGDGCLEEGISYEACSFAGTQKLDKLILFYDKNDISIEGDTSSAFSENTAMRFAAMGWQVIDVADVNDTKELRRAIAAAKHDRERPSVIICHSVIGYGTPLAGTAAVHGTPLTDDQLNKTKDYFGWDEQPFDVPDDVKNHCLQTAAKRRAAEGEWADMMKKYRQTYPELAAEYDIYFDGETTDLGDIYRALASDAPEATRISGGKVINYLAERLPNLISGSADLSPSTKTDIKNGGWFSPENRTGRNIHFGVREHAMAGICNGIMLHGGLKIICSTFFTFCDYMKSAMRMSALMKLPVIYVLTHDSIGVGEDGPTHQPVEQLASLRAMPDINVFRPCDRNETAAAFITALSADCPTAIVLSRQNLLQHNGNEKMAQSGGYVIDNCEGEPDLLLIATGSEVGVCSQAKQLLAVQNIKARVISIPCMNIFERQPEKYKKSVIPDNIKARICVESASKLGWREYSGDNGKIIAMNSFGASGPAEELLKHFGFTAENIAATAKEML